MSILGALWPPGMSGGSYKEQRGQVKGLAVDCNHHPLPMWGGSAQRAELGLALHDKRAWGDAWDTTPSFRLQSQISRPPFSLFCCQHLMKLLAQARSLCPCDLPPRTDPRAELPVPGTPLPADPPSPLCQQFWDTVAMYMPGQVLASGSDV